jgi:hypothetical protein
MPRMSHCIIRSGNGPAGEIGCLEEEHVCALFPDSITGPRVMERVATATGAAKRGRRGEPLSGKLGAGTISTIGAHSGSILGLGRPVWWICVPLFALLSIGISTIAAAEPAIHIELNAAETVQQDHCRLSFVVQNNAESAIDTLKLDLALFDREGTLNRRMIVEVGPLRAAKTIVRTFSVETDCGQIGSILLNDVTACTPGEPGGCLDRLTLSSRPSTIRFFK